MCGIVGYIGTNQAAPILLDGLSKLEYRGYDSAGIAVYDGEKIEMVKSKGRLKVLSELTHDGATLPGTLGIGHTRWATHGEPSDVNAHPHMNKDESIVVVHNGIIENYADRKTCTDLGIYNQQVSDQFYAYIRPQETGTKSDIRWWKQLDMSGNGLQFVSEAPFSASALHYTIDSLDSGWTKQQEHSNEVEEADLTNVLIDKVQMGLGCVNSWGALPDAEYMLPYGDYEFTFIMTPVKHNITIL